MGNYVFLFKENDTDDRDCVRYIDTDNLKDNHVCIDGRFNVCGACYSMSLKEEDADYDNITTVLTESEYKALCNPDGTDLSGIISKLLSGDNDELFEEVQEEEREYLMDEYALDEDDIDEIFNDYGLQYRDRSIVGYVFDDAYDLGYEEAYSLGIIDMDNIASAYFDFERFGNDLVEDGYHCELSDGRIVSLMY